MKSTTQMFSTTKFWMWNLDSQNSNSIILYCGMCYKMPQNNFKNQHIGGYFLSLGSDCCCVIVHACMYKIHNTCMYRIHNTHAYAYICVLCVYCYVHILTYMFCICIYLYMYMFCTYTYSYNHIWYISYTHIACMID